MISLMISFDKLINKIFSDSHISYNDAEKILLRLGFELDICGSHHVFRKANYVRSIALKRRTQIFPYQRRLLQEALIKHGYKKI